MDFIDITSEASSGNNRTFSEVCDDRTGGRNRNGQGRGKATIHGWRGGGVGDEAGNGSGCKRTLMPAPILLNIVILMSAMKSSLWFNANECVRTRMAIPSMPLLRPPNIWPSHKQPF